MAAGFVAVTSASLRPVRAGYAVVRCCVDAVGSEVDFEHIVVFNAEVFGGGLAHHGFGRFGKNDDAVVRCADSDFIFSTNHAE